MNWTRIAEIVSDALAFVLIFRLLSLRLHSVYRVFCLFLISEIALSVLSYATGPLGALDYRTVWMCSRLISWVLVLWVIYRLLGAILENFQGLRAFSRRIFAVAMVAALIVGVTSGYSEYSASGISGLMGITLVLDRVISTAALIILIAILGFILWFPVQMPRNLAVFSIGFAVYFTAKTTLLLARSFWSHESLRLVSNAIMLVLGACYVYWTMFLTQQGKVAVVEPGHRWRPADREHLLLQLEAVNATLLRTARGQAS